LKESLNVNQLFRYTTEVLVILPASFVCKGIKAENNSILFLIKELGVINEK